MLAGGLNCRPTQAHFLEAVTCARGEAGRGQSGRHALPHRPMLQASAVCAWQHVVAPAPGAGGGGGQFGTRSTGGHASAAAQHEAAQRDLTASQPPCLSTSLKSLNRSISCLLNRGTWRGGWVGL